ncbi:hypothetical protein ANN_23459 [Periplaneta americana]|uniref:Uncharacterized protein n=1 Tax=Periplaneta americana TaxID=6978 RepID=A0ABQ8SLK5_PERAM|nr:hypothetical protein ANN_23459 [Periplaneta americana]
MLHLFPLDRVNDAIDKLNEDIDSIVTWTKKLRLKINPGKTQAIILGHKRQTDAVKHLDISPVKKEKKDRSEEREKGGQKKEKENEMKVALAKETTIRNEMKCEMKQKLENKSLFSIKIHSEREIADKILKSSTRRRKRFCTVGLRHENYDFTPYKVNVWCAVNRYNLYGPFVFAEETVRSGPYLDMFKNFFEPKLQQQNNMGIVFQQNVAPSHWETDVRDYLYDTFGNNCCCRGGPIMWPPNSPDVILLRPAFLALVLE